MQHQLGFNLIEILIALAVISIGLFGVAALQVTGVRANQSAYFRSQATFIANDMAERMYANVPALTTGAYDGFDSNNAGCGGAAPTYCEATHGFQDAFSACTPAQIAAYDRFVTACGLRVAATRRNSVADQLPTGRIQVVCLDNTGGATPTCLPNSRYRITVSWNERIVNNTATNAQSNPAQTEAQQVVMDIQS